MFNSLNDIEIMGNKHLGEGAFSQVFKCQLKADKKLYALKIVFSSGGHLGSVQRRPRQPQTRDQTPQQAQTPEHHSLLRRAASQQQSLYSFRIRRPRMSVFLHPHPGRNPGTYRLEIPLPDQFGCQIPPRSELDPQRHQA